jgi:hypothetical protein
MSWRGTFCELTGNIIRSSIRIDPYLLVGNWISYVLHEPTGLLPTRRLIFFNARGGSAKLFGPLARVSIVRAKQC